VGEPLVRPAAVDDDVLRVIREAFGDEGDQVAGIWAELEETGTTAGSIVAEVDGEVLGHVGLSAAWLDARRRLVDVLVLSPLSVLERAQGRGLGTMLVRAAIESGRAGGVPLIFVEGSPAFYGGRGFERASTHGFAPPSDRTPEAAFQVVRLGGHEDWMTGRVVYRDVWWRHDAAGLRDPLLAELEEELG
jgi:putative acetyltransferase